MDTTSMTAAPARRPVAPRVDLRSTDCVCGQDLDGCAGEHCPRCGTQLGAPRLEATGSWRAA